MIREHERTGASAAFAPIDGDEIDAAGAGRHQLREVGPEGSVADRRLDADRQPGGRRDGLDEVEQRVRGPEGAVRGGAGAVPITRNAAGLRDLRADLRLRQQAAGTRLGALTQFDLDRANLRTPRDGLLQPRQAEAAVGLTAAEVAGADLPDQVSPVEVIGRDAPFAGIVQAARDLRPAVERFDRRAAQGSEAHARDVDDRRRAERLHAAARRAEHFRARNRALRVVRRVAGTGRLQRKRLVLDDEVIGLSLHLLVGAESERGVLLLRGRIHPPPLVAAERSLLVIVRHDVLTELRADSLEPVAEVPDDREVPEDRVLALQQVVHDDGGQEPERAEEQDHRAILREPAPAVGMISTDALANLAPWAGGAIMAHVATGRADTGTRRARPRLHAERLCRTFRPVDQGRSVSTGWCRVASSTADGPWRSTSPTTRQNGPALLHESSRARTMPTDRILTCRCDTTLVGRGRSSDSGSHSRGRPHSPAQLDSGREDHRR